MVDFLPNEYVPALPLAGTSKTGQTWGRAVKGRKRKREEHARGRNSDLGEESIELLGDHVVATLGEEGPHLFAHLLLIQVPAVVLLGRGTSCRVGRPYSKNRDKRLQMSLSLPIPSSFLLYYFSLQPTTSTRLKERSCTS